MKLFIHFLLISSLSIIIIDGYIPYLSKSDIETRIKGEQSSTTGLPDSFKLLEEGEIFRNNFTVVWKGTYQDSTDVAVKIVDTKSIFEREMKAFDRLNATEDFDIETQRIPRVYHSGPIFGNYHAIAMTLFEETLEERCELQNHTFSEPTILLIFKQLMETLKYIHSKNVLHNDIKPKNIFIRGQDVFIGDFDLSLLDVQPISDYDRLLNVIWYMVGVPLGEFSGPNDAKLEYFKDLNVRAAFQSILEIDNLRRENGIQPNHEEIIKTADNTLTGIDRKSQPVQFDWLKEAC